MSRRFAHVALLTAVGLMVGLTVVPAAAPAPTRASIPGSVWFRHKASGCQLARGGTQKVVWTDYQMGTKNTGVGSKWVTNMRVKIRLEHPGVGLNPASPWRTTRYPPKGDLLQDRSYQAGIRATSDTYSATQDWRVHIKLVWDRRIPFPDIVQDLSFPLNMNCKSSGTGVWVAPVGGG